MTFGWMRLQSDTFRCRMFPNSSFPPEQIEQAVGDAINPGKYSKYSAERIQRQLEAGWPTMVLTDSTDDCQFSPWQQRCCYGILFPHKEAIPSDKSAAESVAKLVPLASREGLPYAEDTTQFLTGKGVDTISAKARAVCFACRFAAFLALIERCCDKEQRIAAVEQEVSSYISQITSR